MRIDLFCWLPRTYSWVRALALLLALFEGRPSFGQTATPTITVTIDYSRENQSDELAQREAYGYFRLIFSRLGYDRFYLLRDYVRDCPSTTSSTNRACPPPDFNIRLQIAERAGEAQLSGSVVAATKIPSERPQQSTLEIIRVKITDLRQGLSRVVDNAQRLLDAALPPPERTRVSLACFQLDQTNEGSNAPLARLVEEMPTNLVQLMEGGSRIDVSIAKIEQQTACGSLQQLQAFAKSVGTNGISARSFRATPAG